MTKETRKTTNIGYGENRKGYMVSIPGGGVITGDLQQIFLTGRPHVGEAIQRYFTKVVVMPVSPNQDDIRNYLEMRLDRDTEPGAMDNGLRADIVRIILDKISNMCVEAFPFYQ